PADAPHGFGGGALDRNRPLSFKLDGRVIEGFSGDTVLSALLANGMTSSGMLEGEPIALDERSAPLVAPRSEPRALMPMDRVPALAGLDLVTTSSGPRVSLIRRLLSRFSRSGRDALLPQASHAPWLEAEPETTLETDLLVVGGGLAGLAAAKAATGRVILAERRTWLGGDARYFGATGDEETPADAIARLTAGLEAEVLLSTEIFALIGTTARAHQVQVENGRLRARVIAIAAQRVVLATGSFERLPLFAGNRLPGVVGAIAAYHRAERFGLWSGKRTLISTPAAHGYRLALYAKDAGAEVQRITDTRVGPNSRFIDFCKASGVPFTNGLVLQSANRPKGSTALSVGFAVAIDHVQHQTGLTETDLLVAGGALQPDLILWLRSGGRAAWHNGALHAKGEIPGVAIAGSAAGYLSLTACLASGDAAVRGTTQPIDDPEIDPIYESPDGATPVAPRLDTHSATWLDPMGHLRRPADPIQFMPVEPLHLGEFAALVQLGAIPVAQAGTVAAERCIAGSPIADTGWRPGIPAASDELPPYLAGRFGPKPQLATVTSADARYFERGALIFASSTVTDPAQAVGVIVGPTPGGGIGGRASIEREASKGETQLFVRDAGGAVPIERIEKLRP
ncbi:MAG TPA: FAD-dependent oxidoreductase, partial [Devosia sp.]